MLAEVYGGMVLNLVLHGRSCQTHFRQLWHVKFDVGQGLVAKMQQGSPDGRTMRPSKD